MPAPYAAHCLCGKTRFRLNAEPLTLYACHCTECQRRSGGAFGLSMWVRRADIEVTEGDPDTIDAVRTDGKPFRSRRCPHCSTLLWSERKDGGEIAIVRPGTFDDTKWLDPVAHIWTRSAQPWFRLPEGVPTWPQQPANMGELVDLWKARHG